VLHDAAGTTSGFRIQQPGAGAIGYCTDIGEFSPKHLPLLSGVSVLVIEANHDPQLVWDNPARPWHHKKRVIGKRGHLSNTQCARAVIDLFEHCGELPHSLILLHLSEDHNTPQLALNTIRTALAEYGLQPRIVYAPRFSCGESVSCDSAAPPLNPCTPHT
jgi:phosphoribosyl 1,2-cyclic phosphodiesterase